MMTSKLPSLPILIIDDEIESLEGFELTLNSNGFNHIETCRDSRHVMGFLENKEPFVILLDLSMPHLSGQDLLAQICVHYPHIPVIIVTGMNEVETAVECMTRGAFDYMVKPVEPGRMVSGVRRAVELQEERLEYKNFREKVLEDDLEFPEVFSEIITGNKKMRSIFQYSETIARTGKPVLITGESGVGKELIAKAIHSLSNNRGKFVSVNVAGLDDLLFSDTLFGHLKGAFTTAEQQRSGLIKKAAGGTLFLDEIGDLSLVSQLKLLRILQEKEYYPMGSDIPIEMDTRIITATNQNLIRLMEKRVFRNDLYYRIQTHHIHIPPLRDRTSDIPLLLEHFLGKTSASLGKKKPTPPRELASFLAGYGFPGNIRELKAMVFDAVSNHKQRMLSIQRFKEHVGKHQSPTLKKQTDLGENNHNPFAVIEPLPTLRQGPKYLLAEAMRRSHGNKVAAAMMLGITRSGLNKALKRAGINRP
ncbi:MAG: sigma-54 dependent transcriptional regulator [Desulfobacula sp.]|nr:sigma-54 dependent transcriptional regulator [Desulfobacula sp.]